MCDSCAHLIPIRTQYFIYLLCWKDISAGMFFHLIFRMYLSPVLNWCLLLRCACHGINNLIPNDMSTLWVQGGLEDREQNTTHYKKRGVKRLFNHYELRKNYQTIFFSTAWVFSSLKQERKQLDWPVRRSPMYEGCKWWWKESLLLYGLSLLWKDGFKQIFAVVTSGHGVKLITCKTTPS